MTSKETINPELSLSSAVAMLHDLLNVFDDMYNITVSEKYGIITVENTALKKVVRIIMPYYFVNLKPKRLKSNKVYIHCGSTVLSMCSEQEQLAADTLEVICHALTVALLGLEQLPTLHSPATQTDLDIKQFIFNTLIKLCADTENILTILKPSLEFSVHQFLVLMAVSQPCLYGRHIRIPFYRNVSALAVSIGIYVADCIISHLNWLNSLQTKKGS